MKFSSWVISKNPSTPPSNTRNILIPDDIVQEKKNEDLKKKVNLINDNLYYESSKGVVKSW